jgi:chaperonin GroES
MSNVEPLDDRVLLRPVEAAEITKGGIHLPTTAREKPHEGIVVTVGPGKRGPDGERVELYVNEGDKVIYSKYAGTEIKIDGVDHVILRESDLIARTEVGQPAEAPAEPAAV